MEKQLAVEVKEHLLQKIVLFWRNLRDDENGGYYGWLSYDLQLDKKSVKGCILNSRITWFFANAYTLYKTGKITDTDCLLAGFSGRDLLAEAKHGYEICNLLKQFRLIFCYSLFPYKCILICTGFYFSTINKNGFSRNFTQIKKSIGHFSKNTFCAWCKMNASKSRKSCMIWGWSTFKKKHEIDISFTIQLHGTG